MERSPDKLYDSDELTELQKERIRRADEVYKKVCEESGIKVSAWYAFEAWKDFVDGKIEESQLQDKAKVEMERFSESFGKYVVIDKQEESKHHKEEEEKKERAKRANKIYRKVCGEAGLNVCFFHDFKSWSEFVEGKIEEAEFYERAKTEAQHLTCRGRSAAGGQ